MKRPWQIWTVFAVCVSLLLFALLQITFMVLRLDQEQIATRRLAAQEETVRLAMWRMESAVMPLVGRESARSFWDYQAFHPARRAYTRLFSRIQEGDVLVPSPLLRGAPPNVLLHFQYEPDGALTSPQVPAGNMRDLAEAWYTSAEKIGAYAERLERVRALLPRGLLMARLKGRDLTADTAKVHVTVRQQQVKGQFEQMQRSSKEWKFRISNKAQNTAVLKDGSTAQSELSATERNGSADGNTAPGALAAVLVGDALFLARRNAVNGRTFVQGCWLDWPAIRDELLSGIRDLLPNARLLLAGDGQEGDAEARARSLAAIGNVRLLPGPLPREYQFILTPIRLSVTFAWVCILAAAGAVALLLHGAIALSERRGDFVSAVTHELRTPLTTFRMYAEMLSENMVVDEAKRGRYLRTLRVEADRLGHLVENVLAFARIERGRHGAQVQDVDMDALVARIADRLEQRAAQANMRLVVAGLDGLAVRADPTAMEHILFNLVDNACKYAGDAENREIRLEAVAAGGSILLRVRDFGPGVSREERDKLFKPFSKSAHEAAHSAPGIGLGLSLCRRLARSMGGDLTLDSAVSHGACFVLRLPALRG